MQGLEREIVLNGEPLRLVKCIIYLGSEIIEEGKIGDEISRRLQKLVNFYQAVKHLLWNKKISERANVLIYRF